jgi:hypothetical protein
MEKLERNTYKKARVVWVISLCFNPKLEFKWYTLIQQFEQTAFGTRHFFKCRFSAVHRGFWGGEDWTASLQQKSFCVVCLDLKCVQELSIREEELAAALAAARRTHTSQVSQMLHCIRWCHVKCYRVSRQMLHCDVTVCHVKCYSVVTSDVTLSHVKCYSVMLQCVTSNVTLWCYTVSRQMVQCVTSNVTLWRYTVSRQMLHCDVTLCHVICFSVSRHMFQCVTSNVTLWCYTVSRQMLQCVRSF